MHKPQSGIMVHKLKWDTTQFADFIATLSVDEWEKWDLRQSTFIEHKHTQSIKVMWVPFNVKKFNEAIVEKNEPFYTLTMLKMGEILKFLQEYYDGVIYKILIVRMKPYTIIPTHRDSGYSLDKPHRIHIPIITNKEVFFQCGSDNANMEAGSLYEINNSLPHSVINNSSSYRTHVIVDVLEKKDI